MIAITNSPYRDIGVISGDNPQIKQVARLQSAERHYMQRTVKTTIFTYAKTTLNEKGEVQAELAKIEVAESDEKKALRKAVKQIGLFAPLKTETKETLYKLDDDIFFKYAKPVTDEEKKEEEEGEE